MFFLGLVLNIKIIYHRLFFDHLGPGASTSDPGRKIKPIIKQPENCNECPVWFCSLNLLAALLFDVSYGRRGSRVRLPLNERRQCRAWTGCLPPEGDA